MNSRENERPVNGFRRIGFRGGPEFGEQRDKVLVLEPPGNGETPDEPEETFVADWTVAYEAIADETYNIGVSYGIAEVFVVLEV